MAEKVYDKNSQKEFYSRKGADDYLPGKCTNCGGEYEDSKMAKDMRDLSGADPVCCVDCFVENQQKKGLI
jgi:hypothetical protein